MPGWTKETTALVASLSVLLGLCIIGIGVATFYGVYFHRAYDEERSARAMQRMSLQRLRASVGREAEKPRAVVPAPSVSRFSRYLIQSYKMQHLVPGLARNVQNNRRMCPRWKMLYFDDLDLSLFIQKHFPGRISKALQTLVPGAFRSDMLRLAALYRFGGCWADVYFEFQFDLDELLLKHVPAEANLVVVRDVNQRDLFNAFIVATPEHPAVLHALEVAADRVLSKSYSHGCLGVTGPGCLGSALNTFCGLPEDHRYTPFTMHGDDIYVLSHIPSTIQCTPEGSVFTLTRYPNFARDRVLHHGVHYSHHFDRKNVFHPRWVGAPALTPRGAPHVLLQTWEIRGMPVKMAENCKAWQAAVEGINCAYGFLDVIEKRALLEQMSAGDCFRRLIDAHDALTPAVLREELLACAFLARYGGAYVAMDCAPPLNAVKRSTVFAAEAKGFTLVVVQGDRAGEIGGRFVAANRGGHPLLQVTLELLLTWIEERCERPLRLAEALTLAYREMGQTPKGVRIVPKIDLFSEPEQLAEACEAAKLITPGYDLDFTVNSGNLYRDAKLTQSIFTS